MEKVVESKNDAGEKVHILRLSNGGGVRRDREEGARRIILQTMAGEPLRELLRFGFTIRPEKTRDLRETPAELRGVWTARRASKDQGKTDERIAPTPLATVYATQTKSNDGKMSDLVKITEIKRGRGPPRLAAHPLQRRDLDRHEDGEPGVYLLQVMRGEPFMEVLRFEDDGREQITPGGSAVGGDPQDSRGIH